MAKYRNRKMKPSLICISHEEQIIAVISSETKISVSCIPSHKHYTVNPHGNNAGYDNVLKYMMKNRMFRHFKCLFSLIRLGN